MESTAEHDVKCTVMAGIAGSSVGQENIMQLADDRLLPSLGSFVAALERFAVDGWKQVEEEAERASADKGTRISIQAHDVQCATSVRVEEKK